MLIEVTSMKLVRGEDITIFVLCGVSVCTTRKPPFPEEITTGMSVSCTLLCTQRPTWLSPEESLRFIPSLKNICKDHH